jgi:hypothetical protein
VGGLFWHQDQSTNGPLRRGQAMRCGGGRRDASARSFLCDMAAAVGLRIAAPGPAGVMARAAFCRPALLILSGGLLMGGCTSGSPMLVNASYGGGSTVAFESIDGPPETVFRRLVVRLNEEASARKLAVVSRDAAAQYRIRGYVSAHVQGKKTTLAWVWDIFDAGSERAIRLSGEVPGAASERAWAAADDQAISRMAQDGIDRLSTFLASPVSTQPNPVPSLPTDRPDPNIAFAPTENALAFVPSSPSR